MPNENGANTLRKTPKRVDNIQCDNKTQKEISKEIDQISSLFNDDTVQLTNRVDLCYEKIQWCRKRRLQWERYKQTEFEAAKGKIIDPEKNLLQHEKLMSKIDSKKPSKPPYQLKTDSHTSQR